MILNAEALARGHYLYDGQPYLQKQQVFDAALAKGDLRPDIRYIFNDDVYGAIDWSVEPEPSLKELYTARARELRETYDHLVLMYSGGADSTEVLHTFAQANIHLDEIQTYWPLRLLKQDGAPDPHDEIGVLYEYHLAALPRLRDFARAFPATRISVVDMTDYVIRHCNESFLADHVAKMRVRHNIFRFYQCAQQIDMINRLHEQIPNKRIGVIYGIDFTRPRLEEDMLFFMFTDRRRSGTLLPYFADALSHTPEMFFWSPQAPLIPVKQMHVVKRELECNVDFYTRLRSPRRAPRAGIRYRQDDQLEVQRLLYYSSDPTRYQARILGRETNALRRLFPDDTVDALRSAKDRLLCNKYGKLAGAGTAAGDDLLHRLDPVIYSRPYFLGRLSLRYAA